MNSSLTEINFFKANNITDYLMSRLPNYKLSNSGNYFYQLII